MGPGARTLVRWISVRPCACVQKVFVRTLHVRFVFRWGDEADVQMILCDRRAFFCAWISGRGAHGLERPVDCVVPVSSETSLRAMAKAMKKAAAPAMKAMKAVNTQAKGTFAKKAMKAAAPAMKAMKAVNAEAKGTFAKKAMKAAAMKAMKVVNAEAKSTFAKKAMKAAAMKAMK